MSETAVLEVALGALEVAAKLALPALLVSLVIGVFVSLLQTITQIQEMSLTFVPKLIGVALVLLLAGPWMIRELVGWVTRLWTDIPLLS